MTASTILYVSEHVTDATKNLRLTYNAVMKIRHSRGVNGELLQTATKIWDDLYAIEARLGQLLIDIAKQENEHEDD